MIQKHRLRVYWQGLIRRRIVVSLVSIVFCVISVFLRLYITAIVNTVAVFLVWLSLVVVIDRQGRHGKIIVMDSDLGNVKDELMDEAADKNSTLQLRIRRDKLFTTFNAFFLYGLVCILLPPLFDCVPMHEPGFIIFMWIVMALFLIVPLYRIAASAAQIKEGRN